MQQNNTIVHCKVLYNNEFRRFPLSKGFSLADLKDKIKTLLNLDSDFFVKYKDEENDWITISSDLELETGLSLCPSNLFRLSISVVYSISPSGKESAACNDDLYVPMHRRHGCRRGKRRSSENEEDKDDEERDCGRYRKGRRGCRRGKGRWNRESENRDEEDKEEDKNEERDCGRFRKGGKRGRCGRGRGRWNRGWDHREEKFSEAAELSSGASDEEDATLSLPEIKKEIESLKEENTLLKDKKGNLSKEVLEMKNSIKAKRQDPNASREDILNLKTELRSKKQSYRPLFAQFRSNRNRIRKLQELASNKSQ